MIKKEFKSTMYEINSLLNNVNRIFATLNNERQEVFDSPSLVQPRFATSEAGFLYVISWLYVHYFETGKVGVEFLSNKFEAYSLNSSNSISIHPSRVNKLRTYLQHNLDLKKKRNLKIQEECENWLKDQCGTILPNTEDDWNLCLNGLLVEAHEFFHKLEECIRCIEKDDMKNAIMKEWEFKITRYHPPHEFDKLIEIVSTDMGRNNIDAVKLRKRYYSKWSSTLELHQGDYEFNTEARKLIEHVILSETTKVLPITGADIIKDLDIEAGPNVGELLFLAKKLFDEETCSKDNLLEKLRSYIL